MKTILKSNKYSAILIIVFAIGALLGLLYTITPGIQGDGMEYILQTVAFQNHFSFGITEEDLNEAQEEFYNQAESLGAEYNNEIHMHESGSAKYSNHYGTYSALVTPVKRVILALGIYPLWAFSITNYILWLVAIFVVFFCLRTNAKRKFCVLALLVFNPIIFYLPWSHSEMYIFAFMVIGLVFYYNKQYGRSIFFLSVSAMQNLGVMPFAMIVGIDYIVECMQQYKGEYKKLDFAEFAKLFCKKVIPYGIFYIPAFLPLISTYIRFGTYNLVADVAMEDKYLFHKAIDYVFDLNLGILPYEPIVLICFILMAIIGLKKYTRPIIINLVGVFGMLYIIAHQIQINSGMQNIMRYNVWIIPVLIFFIVMNLNIDKDNGKRLITVCVSEAVFTTGIIGYIFAGGGSFGCYEFAPWTKVIMNSFPEIYNPTHGIFYSRASGVESYGSPKPVIYNNNAGYIRKILLSKEAEKVFYSENWTLVDSQGNSVDKNKLKTKMVDERQYKYINIKDNCQHLNEYKLGDKIFFASEDYNADDYVQSGISGKEEKMSWTDSDEVHIGMLLNDSAPLIKGHIDVVGTFYHPQEVTILINESEVFCNKIEGDQDIDFVFENPKNKIVNMTILLPDSLSPAKLRIPEDGRTLGISIKEMVFTDD